MISFVLHLTRSCIEWFYRKALTKFLQFFMRLVVLTLMSLFVCPLISLKMSTLPLITSKKQKVSSSIPAPVALEQFRLTVVRSSGNFLCFCKIYWYWKKYSLMCLCNCFHLCLYKDIIVTGFDVVLPFSCLNI